MNTLNEQKFACIITGDVMSREDAIELIEEAQQNGNEFDAIFGMSIEEALASSFREIDTENN